jgi:N-acyl-D-aspartate/D-glutamate deacylase
MTRDRTRGPKLDLAHMVRMQTRDTAGAGLHDRGGSGAACAPT